MDNITCVIQWRSERTAVQKLQECVNIEMLEIHVRCLFCVSIHLNFYLLHSFGYISFFPYFLYFSDFLYFNANLYRSLIFFERSARLNFYRSFPPLHVELSLLFRLVIICFVSIFLSLCALGLAISPAFSPSAALAARSAPSTRPRFLCALQRFSRFRAA